MAQETFWNAEDLERFEVGDRDAWNAWRETGQGARPTLWFAQPKNRSLAGWDLSLCDLRLVRLDGADFRGADLRRATLRGSDLRGSDFDAANLDGSDFGEAQMDGGGFDYSRPTNLHSCRFVNANLRGAIFKGAIMTNCQLVRSDASHAVFDGAQVYGVAVWDLSLQGSSQRNLYLGEGLWVDRLDMAQFTHQLMNSDSLRHILNTFTTRTVLILGRFTKERRAYLDVVREAVRGLGIVPILFDFESPERKDLTGTIESLARLARFVIVDISDPRSVPHELAAIVPHLRTTPVVSVQESKSTTYALFGDLRAYPWVLPTLRYDDEATLRTLLPTALRDADSYVQALRR